jgi:C-terminal processing protease CtpA/Prc
LLTSKRDDHLYHFRYIEKHTYKPRKNNFYNGNIYVLISGPSFSAATLFAHTIKGLPNVSLVGEETGGGDYGNNGLMIPDIRLPNTGIKVRMPLFRIVQFQHGIKNGKGVLPDVLVLPTAEGVRNNRDLKLEKAIALIEEKSKQSTNQSIKN